MITSRMVRLVSLLCIFALCIGIGACAPAEQAVPPAGARIIMIPPSGISGTYIKIYGSGFQEGEEINLEIVNAKLIGFDMANYHVGPEAAEIVARASGAWSSDDWVKGDFGQAPQITLLEPGAYTLRATGNKGSVATTPYIVVEKKVEKK